MAVNTSGMRIDQRLMSVARRLVHKVNGHGGGLAERTARSVFWVFFSYGGGRVLNFIRMIILARLLLPYDFGVIGMAEVATGFLAMLIEIGVAPAIIYKQDAPKEALDTAWTISVLRGVALCLITLLLTGLIAGFYNTPELVAVLRVEALLFVLAGLSSTGPILLQKEMDFRKLAFFELISNILSLVVTIVLALMVHSYWALVLGNFAQGLVVLAGSFIIHPYRPSFRWQSQSAREILNYGKYIFGSGIVNYFLTQGDNALVGKVLGTDSLGLYRMAYNISSMPSTSITSVVGQVAFPAYAKLQKDIPALRAAYFNMVKLVSALAVPMIGGMMVLGYEFVEVLLGEKWLPMAPAFIVLCVYGLERAINASVAPLFKASGEPKIIFYLTLFKLALLAIIIYPFTMKLGILGTSFASSIVAVSVSLNVLRPVARTLQCRIVDVIRPLGGAFAATGVMVAALLGVKLAGWVHPNLVSLLVWVVLGALVYALSYFLFDQKAVRQVWQLVTDQLKPAETIS